MYYYLKSSDPSHLQKIPLKKTGIPELDDTIHMLNSVRIYFCKSFKSTAAV